MGDTSKPEPNAGCLFDIASEQRGHFTRLQASECGYGTDLLTYHTRTGRFERAHRGVYRLRDYPSSPHDYVIAAWLAVGKIGSRVSHESALDLLDLSDVIPNGVHITVPRSRRNLPKLPGVRMHTSTRPFGNDDAMEIEGIRITSPARSIVDSADAGTGPEQIEMAIREALDRGITTPRRLNEAADGRNRRVRNLVAQAMEGQT